MTIVGWVLIILGVALFVVGLSGVFFWAGHGKAVDQNIPAKPLTDEDIAMVQFAFERRLEGDSDLSDAVVWGDAYIYWQLMSKWFRTLLEKHRNNDKLAAKLRSDWLDYLHCLETLKTGAFLSREADRKEKRDLYGGEAEQSWRSKLAIEDAFAAVIGDEAPHSLRRIRAAKHNAFDRSGKKPMAPDGYYYSPVSFNPYLEELKPERRT